MRRSSEHLGDGKKIMGRFRECIVAYEAKLDLKTKGEKRWFWVAFALLVLYMEFVAYAQNTAYGGNVPIMDTLSALAVIPLCVLGVLFFHKVRFTTRYKEKRQGNRRMLLLFCVAVFFLTFLYSFAWQMAYWPGSFFPDSISQYEQSISGTYNDWHPAIHTWLFFTLPNKIHVGPALIVSMQMFWFSMTVTYSLSVLYRCGASRLFLFLSWAYILANPSTMCLMLCPYKDSALCIFSLVVFAQVVQIYASSGAWLRKWYNLAAFATFCFLAMNMRHNALLLVIPLLVILTFFCKKTRLQVLIVLGGVIGGTVILKGPVFHIVGVEIPGERTVETVGLPMTVLANIYVNDRDSLPSDVRFFLDSVATEDQWGSFTGTFNSIKWSGINRGLIDEKGLPIILDYMVRSWKRSPRLAWEAFVDSTRVVWSIDGGGGWWFATSIGIVDNSFGIQYHNQIERIQREFAAYSARVGQYGTKYFFKYIGILIAILLFMSVANIGNGKLGRVFVVLSLMVYDFGTMLLLSAPDFRFFQFNFLIVIPLLFLMGAREDDVVCVEKAASGEGKGQCPIGNDLLQTEKSSFCEEHDVIDLKGVESSNGNDELQVDSVENGNEEFSMNNHADDPANMSGKDTWLNRLANKYVPERFRDIFLYLIVGGLATLVEWGVFWVFDDALKIHYLVATAIAFIFSTFANWLFGRILMFQRGESMSLIREIASIYLTSIVGLLLNLVIMFVLVRFLSIHEMVSKVIATVLVFAYNYVVRKKVIYKSESEK